MLLQRERSGGARRLVRRAPRRLAAAGFLRREVSTQLEGPTVFAPSPPAGVKARTSVGADGASISGWATLTRSWPSSAPRAST